MLITSCACNKKTLHNIQNTTNRGAGYIGSVLTQYLLEENELFVLDNFNSVNPSLAAYCSNENFHPIKGDVRDEKIIKELIEKVDLVIPLAALVGAPLQARSHKCTIY